MAGDLAFHSQLVEEQIAVAENGGEEIVEVVSDTAGQLAEGFHFLRTNELILELFSRRDVHERTDETHRLAVPIANDGGALKEIEIGAVHVPEPVFARPIIAVAGE